MKELLFVRHAKSDWGNESLKDIDRHLSERGYSDAYFSSEWYQKNHAMPDLIITSPATRAMNTALIFARATGYATRDIQLEDSVYEASIEDLLNLIHRQEKGDRIMLFGHNPGFTNICNELSDEIFFDNVPTCGIVSLTFETNDWSGIQPHAGKLKFYKFPKDFKNHA